MYNRYSQIIDRKCNYCCCQTWLLGQQSFRAPPPQKKKIDRRLFFAGYLNFFPQRKSGFREGYSELKPQNVFLYIYID